MSDKYTRTIRRLAKDGLLTPEITEKMVAARSRDGGPGSGNFGHSGRPGKVGGSAESVSGGRVGGNAGKNSTGHVFSGKEYSLRQRGLQSPGSKAKRSWSTKGKRTKSFPQGSGTTRIAEEDVRRGLHSVNRYLQSDGTLSPERAALHERIISELFAGKKPVGPGEQKTFYFLGGGSASGKSNFTSGERGDIYGVPTDKVCAVIDADKMKEKLPEYDYNEKTKEGPGTTDREKAASFAHEESSALAKRAMEAAFANGYNCTLDGTGDGSVKGVMKKIKQARDAGYRVEGRYCTRDIERAIESNIERAIKSGRKVQTDSVISIHKAVSEIFPQVAGEFDHCELWDHNGKTPVKIAECDRGGKMKVLDKGAYQKFIDKVNFKYQGRAS